MSFQVQTIDGNHVEARFTGILRPEGILIGEHEMDFDHFGAMSAHFLTGGLLGWPQGETPEAINSTLDTLFNAYEKRDGKWVRKS